MSELINCTCPNCDTSFEMPIELSGHKRECNNCNCIFQISGDRDLFAPLKEKLDIIEPCDEINDSDYVDLDDDISNSQDLINEIFSACNDSIDIVNHLESPKTKQWISDDYDGLMIYMNQINNLPHYNMDEENHLVTKLQNGDLDAKILLLEANLKLVPYIAKSFQWANMDILDLIQEGNIGLIKAVEKYNPKLGAKFGSYAAWWIKQYIRRYIGNFSSTIRIPIQSNAKLEIILSEIKSHSGLFSKEPTDNIISEKTGFSNRSVGAFLKSAHSTLPIEGFTSLTKPYSLYSYYVNSNSSYLVSPDYSYDSEAIISRLMDSLNFLGHREKKVIEMRFGINGNVPATLDEVSHSMHRTRERVRQLESSALEKLKLFIEEDYFYSIKCKYHFNCEAKVDYIYKESIDEEVKLAICEIFDDENTPLSLEQINKIWNIKYPKFYISDRKLRMILNNPLFKTIKGEKKFYALEEWPTGEEINLILLKAKIASGRFNDIIDEPLLPFNNKTNKKRNVDKNNKKLTDELLKMFIL